MRKLFGFLGISIISLGIATIANAAEPSRGSRAGAMSAQRMPTMPMLPINTIGNFVDTSGQVGGGNTGGGTGPVVPPIFQCPANSHIDISCTGLNIPAGQNCVSASCKCDTTAPLANNGVCTPGGQPPVGDCPDGQPRNSEYTVDMCMNDVLACVNGGALPNGLNDLFNSDLRNSIFNGMNLCAVQVDKCISEVRKNCHNVYHSFTDVWIDFNSRKVQPEYYAFVLRKTGLTPNQAENTCALLDVNTYGASFDAVANSGKTTSEYNNKINAYNGQGPDKNKPQGVTPNYGNSGVDGQRGHYARWDAVNADCLVRVAAYNKDTLITNDYGWILNLGDDKVAEVWQNAGSSFTCNKNLFEFSLMNNTSTVAIWGIGGGTLAGAGIGAIAGHGHRDFNCQNKGHREELTKQLRGTNKTGVLNEYLDAVKISATGDVIDEMQCAAIINLYDSYAIAKTELDNCRAAGAKGGGVQPTHGVWATDFVMNGTSVDWTKVNYQGKIIDIQEPKDADKKEILAILAEKDLPDDQQTIERTSPFTITESGFVSSGGSATAAGANDRCNNFTPLVKARTYSNGEDVYCNPNTGCNSFIVFSQEVNNLGNVFNSLTILKEGQKSNMLKSTLTGAGIGAAAGGVATAITAFVEKNNINCRVGDGLEKVGFGKSYTIGTLKDFYVKWALNLPDTISPTAQVVDCHSWKNACGTLKDLRQCSEASINYKPYDAPKATLVAAACMASGSVCIENYSVAKSYGACD
ncbi:MAG: hypothetical protein LBJ18_00465 [Rickettsiales bacterium]|jgi:hypothetical protein|nr:hypothetical protein [Rickettsiales bacterium]